VTVLFPLHTPLVLALVLLIAFALFLGLGAVLLPPLVLNCCLVCVLLLELVMLPLLLLGCVLLRVRVRVLGLALFLGFLCSLLFGVSGPKASMALPLHPGGIHPRFALASWWASSPLLPNAPCAWP